MAKVSQIVAHEQDATRRVKALAASEVEVLLTLCRALEPTRDEVALTPTTVRSPEDAEKAAMSLRAKWKLGDQPIESVTATIEDGGGLVVESPCDDDVFDRLSGWANESVPVVVVSSDVSDDRRRFSLAHELGHLFMDVRDVNERTGGKSRSPIRSFVSGHRCYCTARGSG